MIARHELISRWPSIVGLLDPKFDAMLYGAASRNGRIHAAYQVNGLDLRTLTEVGPDTLALHSQPINPKLFAYLIDYAGMLSWEGHHNAIVGIAFCGGEQRPVVVYNGDQMKFNLLASTYDSDEAEAKVDMMKLVEAHFNEKVLPLAYGDATPFIVVSPLPASDFNNGLGSKGGVPLPALVRTNLKEVKPSIASLSREEPLALLDETDRTAYAGHPIEHVRESIQGLINDGTIADPFAD